MLKKLIKHARQALNPLRALLPYRFVSRLDAEEYGCFNWQTRELLSGFPIHDADTVVDVGCGAGAASEFAALCGAAVFAVDIDAQAIAGIQRRIKGLTLARPFQTVVSDANPLPLADGIATRVVAQEVIEHVDDPRQFLGELVRVGQPGALYLLSVPDAAAESVQKVLAPDHYWRKPNHLRIFERDDFDRLIEDAGLQIQQRVNYSFFWAMWWILFWSDHGGFEFGSAGTSVLKNWNKTWAALLRAPYGPQVRKALDDFMPKSQVVIARKAA
jgi:SAM-dependent methyltransferase